MLVEKVEPRSWKMEVDSLEDHSSKRVVMAVLRNWMLVGKVAMEGHN